MATTVKRQTNNGTMVFTRRTEEEARKLFNEGVTISVMTADRNPADSLTTEIDYTKGEELFWNGERNIACDFDQVIEDFAEWQENDGYGHCPDHDAAENYDFSFWTFKLENHQNKMNMKTNILLFIAALIMCESCQWNKYNDSVNATETKKTYIQTNNSQQNYPESENSDSTYIYYSNFNESRLNSIREDSTLCNIFIEGKLIINGGYYTDISDTYVTVEKVTVNIRIDDGEKITYYPEVNTNVAEPGYVYEWNNMPEGINYNRKELTTEPLTISYKEKFCTEVTVDYALRVRDTKLAAECTIDHYSNTVTYQSMQNNIIKKNILVPLELTTIEFSATVSNYE